MGALRLLLAVSVLCAHTALGGMFTSSALAVQLFYMISGFLIAHVLAHNPSYQSKARFLGNRALRIFPVYLAVAALTLLYHLAFDRSFFAAYGQVSLGTAIAAATANVTIVGQDWLMFMRHSAQGLGFTTNFRDSSPPLFELLLAPQAWSLGVELSFYAVAPFILKRSPWLVAALLASLAVRVTIFKLGLGWQDPWTYRFFPSELALFLLGAASQRWVLPWWQSQLIRRTGDAANRAASLVAVAACAVYMSTPLPSHIKGPALVALMVLLLPGAFLFNQRSRADQVMAELSYPLYICHVLVTLAVQQSGAAWGLHLPPAWEALTVFVLGVVFALALNRFVQSPVERWRNRLRQPRPSAATA